MTPAFASAVDPVFSHVIELLERLGRGETLLATEERARIRGWIDQAEARLGQRDDWKLAKYALVAWIDDLLIDAPWEGRVWWRENALEVEVFNTRLRNEEFYSKAKLASSQTAKDALEVFYLCVVLGFRGLYRDPAAAAAAATARGLPADLEAWARQTSAALVSGLGRPVISDETRPGEGAPPLEGLMSLVSSAFTGVVLAALALILVWIAFFS